MYHALLFLLYSYQYRVNLLITRKLFHFTEAAHKTKNCAKVTKKIYTILISHIFLS